MQNAKPSNLQMLMEKKKLKGKEKIRNVDFHKSNLYIFYSADYGNKL